MQAGNAAQTKPQPTDSAAQTKPQPSIVDTVKDIWTLIGGESTDTTAHDAAADTVHSSTTADTAAAAPIVVKRPRPERTAEAEAARLREALRADSLAMADSVAMSTQADSLAMTGTADSLAALPATPIVWRDATASEVFGTTSQYVAGRKPFAAERQATDYPSFDIFILLLSLIYAILLYNKADNIRYLFGGVAQGAATGKVTSNPRGGFSLFLNAIVFIGTPVAGVVIARIAEPLIPLGLDFVPPQFAAVVASLLASALVIAIVLYQRTILWMAGEVTLTQQFVLQIRQIKSIHFTGLILTISPVAIFFAICPESLYNLWFGIIAAGSAITIILYLAGTLQLFISKKISILLWFLYLCTVEIFPLSLLWLLAVR